MNNNHFLEWPFFDDSHRRLAGELQAWVHTHRHTLEADGVDEKQAVRSIAQCLGADGWLRYLLPAARGGPHAKLDVRSLCVVRDVLARCSGLADCTFAMQGLGAVPLVLFGSAAQQERTCRASPMAHASRDFVCRNQGPVQMFRPCKPARGTTKVLASTF